MHLGDANSVILVIFAKKESQIICFEGIDK